MPRYLWPSANASEVFILGDGRCRIGYLFALPLAADQRNSQNALKSDGFFCRLVESAQVFHALHLGKECGTAAPIVVQNSTHQKLLQHIKNSHLIHMPSVITNENWQTIRQHFRKGFETNLYVAIGTVNAEGQPNITPIGSFFLNKDDFSGFYFEIFSRSIPENAKTNTAVCIMAVNSSKWFWFKSLLFGKFATPPMTKIYGTLGERRLATPEEIVRGNRRLGRMKLLPGGKTLFGNMPFVREISLHSFDFAKLPI